MTMPNEAPHPVASVYSLRRRLNELNTVIGLSWREIAALDEYKGISFATLAGWANGKPVSPKMRKRLGIVRKRCRLFADVDAQFRKRVRCFAVENDTTISTLIEVALTEYMDDVEKRHWKRAQRQTEKTVRAVLKDDRIYCKKCTPENKLPNLPYGLVHHCINCVLDEHKT